MKKIAIATSNRADWGLLHPLVKELTERGVKPIIIATYAHLLPEMGETINELIDDGFPPAMSVPARSPLHEAVGDTVAGFTKALQFLKPDMLVVLGDRVEMLGVATAALMQGVPIAHLAGGAVTEGAFDDAIRNAISQMATYHFPETEKSRRRLILMGARPENVVVTGATGVYNTMAVENMELSELESWLDFPLGSQFLLGTFHPATAGNDMTGSKGAISQMKIWIEGLEKALDENPELKLLLTFPNSDTDVTPLASLLFTLQTSRRDRVKVVTSLGRVRYINAARHAAVVAGNSSSGIIELPSVGVPVVDVGVRQQGRQRSTAIIHCELDAADISKAIGAALTPESRKKALETPNPYFKENTPRIIADFLLKDEREDKFKDKIE